MFFVMNNHEERHRYSINGHLPRQEFHSDALSYICVYDDIITTCYAVKMINKNLTEVIVKRMAANHIIHEQQYWFVFILIVLI